MLIHAYVRFIYVYSNTYTRPYTSSKKNQLFFSSASSVHRDVLYTILHFSFIPHSAATPFLTHTCVINSSLKHSIKIPHGPAGKRRDIVRRLLFLFFFSSLPRSPFSSRDTCSVYLISNLPPPFSSPFTSPDTSIFRQYRNFQTPGIVPRIRSAPEDASASHFPRKIRGVHVPPLLLLLSRAREEQPRNTREKDRRVKRAEEGLK